MTIEKPIDAVICRASISLPATASNEFMYMPGGLQTITPMAGMATGADKKPIAITVLVDANGAAELNRQHAAILARKKRPLFDFNHEDGAASFWPERYFWSEAPAPGIYCRGEWTTSGKAGVEGKEWRQFSPVFHVDKKIGATPSNPARITCLEYAKPNMGGLVNDAAFHNISPLWAKDAGEASEAAQPATNQPINKEMKPLSTSFGKIIAEAPNTIMKAFAEVVAKNARVRVTPENTMTKTALAREAAAIFARDIEGNDALALMSMQEAIQAADTTDISVGTLSGTLVMQKTLPLMQYEYPLLGSITSDFSGEAGLLHQTETTRIVVKPPVQSYNTATDSAGRPKGWDTVSPAQTVDVPVTLDEYVGVPIVFGQAMLGATMRSLFDESVPMALYALGGYMVDKLTALFTPANFNAYAGNSATGGVTVSGAVGITVASTANMYPAQAISGTGIPAGARVARVLSGTTAELTLAATASNTGLTFTLNGGKVPTNYTSYGKALADFNMASLGDIRAAFSQNEVPAQGRFAMLNTSYYQRLSQDPTFNTFFAAMRKPEIITEGDLPKLQGFLPMEAPFFPTDNYRVGFAGHRASAILKTRLPGDLSRLGIPMPGSAVTVTAPSGLSVLLVQYINLQSNYAEARPEVMLGAAPGERRAGLVLTSQ